MLEGRWIKDVYYKIVVLAVDVIDGVRNRDTDELNSFDSLEFTDVRRKIASKTTSGLIPAVR